MGIEAGPKRRGIAEQLMAVAIAQLDGVFLEQQLDPVDGDALTARMDRIAWVMGLARDQLLREAGFEVPR